MAVAKWQLGGGISAAKKRQQLSHQRRENAALGQSNGESR